MREYTPENITDVVIEQMSTTPDPRMKEIMESAVRHLHAFAREVKLTPAEWIKGIEFMTKVGQMCTPARQEFILFSDTMGLSALGECPSVGRFKGEGMSEVGNSLLIAAEHAVGRAAVVKCPVVITTMGKGFSHVI